MTDSRTQIFSTRAVFWMIAVGGLAFAGAILFAIFGESIRPSGTPGANAYSTSAIGHKAFVSVLQRIGIPVVISRHGSARRASWSALLVLAEPKASGDDSSVLDEIDLAERVLIVLPKWRGKPDRARRGWLESAERLPVTSPLAVLQKVVPDGKVVPAARGGAWRTGKIGVIPTIAGPQLMEAPSLRPIVTGSGGMLVGELRDGNRRIWILSDPDVLSNHGLGRDDNAVFAVALIDALRPPGGTVVFDETIHGFQRKPSFWRVLFEFPYVICTLLAACAVAILLWSATARFGSPLSAARPLEAGKSGLIANTADLLQLGGHDREILGRYLKAITRVVERQLHTPRTLDEAGRTAWLDRVGAARGLGSGLQQLQRRVQALRATSRMRDGSLLRAAEELHRWKQEMLHGPGGHKGQ